MQSWVCYRAFWYMEETKINTALAGLSLEQFIAQINQERPEITGGCVLLINASFSTAMILMALKISHKRNKEIATKRLLRKRIRLLMASQVQLFQAAESDLKIFNEYRATLKSKAKDRATKLISNLKNATESLLEASVLLTKAIDEARSTVVYADVVVASDVEAGLLILEATLKAIQNMAESNQRMIESH
jgi:formiminotetrahydrofolate cyclodeaminase